MIDIKNEKTLFYNDLSEYTESIEGSFVKQAFKTEQPLFIEITLNYYYYCRNELHQFTYINEKIKNAAIENDKYLSELYKESN